MQIQCPRCQTKYNLEASLLAPEGSQVRCSRCGHEFRAEPPAEPPAEAASPPLYTPPSPSREATPPDSDDLMGFLDEDGRPVGGLEMEEGGRRKGSFFKKFLAFLLILIIILALLLGGLLFMKTRGVHPDRDYLGIDIHDYLPFLKPLEPAGGSPGGAGAGQNPDKEGIHLSGVAGSFLKLEEGRKVFLIKGKAENFHDHPVREIKLRGILGTEDRRNAAESIVFTGHTIIDEEIKSLSRSVIEGILSSPQAAEGTAARVEPGAAADFMIIFFDLPENLIEYTVEVVSWRPATESDTE